MAIALDLGRTYSSVVHRRSWLRDTGEIEEAACSKSS